MTGVGERYKLPLDAYRRPIGCKRVLTWPSKLAVSRLEREAKARNMPPDVLLAKILEILGRDDMYKAILED